MPGTEVCPLLDLPSEVQDCITEHLERAYRACLAATCRTLWAASTNWFRNDVATLDGLQHEEPHLVGLCRVRAQVDLALEANLVEALPLIDTLTAGGARIVDLFLGAPQVLFIHRPPPQQLPAALAGLTQLYKLSLADNRIEGGWQHLPRQLQELDLSDCSLQQVSAALAGLTQLKEVLLNPNPIRSGWQHLPRQLQRLSLSGCGLEQVPAVLAGLTRLEGLWLLGNPINGSWQHVPLQLQQLSLKNCNLHQVPEQLVA